ncbi:MAG: hypothetical protein M1833_004854 [Piccolia ochrophora]|nr:MAG: hypothetical protein M1833_004854 [Piccolia ochrophora]
MKVFESNHTYDYPWEEVSTANWRKYCPWNDKSTHVIAVDTLSRSIDATTGTLTTERLITCRQAAPQWICTLLGGNCTSYVHEVSHVTPSAKTVTMHSTNLTLSNTISCRETVTYSPHPAHPDTKTHFKQDAQITALCGGWQKVKNSIEDFSIDRFTQNAQRGREGFEAVLDMSRRVFGEQRERERAMQAA